MGLSLHLSKPTLKKKKFQYFAQMVFPTIIIVFIKMYNKYLFYIHYIHNNIVTLRNNCYYLHSELKIKKLLNTFSIFQLQSDRFFKNIL